MKVRAIETFLVTLPFRFAFGHSLATRADSTNVIVRVTLDDGTQGFGEGVPRDYVTGENAEAAQQNIEKLYAPRLMGMDVSDRRALLAVLEQIFYELQLDKHPRGASWCAMELAILDAACKAQAQRIVDWFGPIRNERIRYGGVIPFGGKKAVLGMLLFYKLYGFKTVKVKVGKSIEDDERIVAMARKIMGQDATIRVDSNCAWTADQTLRAVEVFRKYDVASYEQPVDPSDLDGLKKITANISEQVLVDESLCTIEQAQHLAAENICSAFNVRISKVGGFIAAQKMIEIAETNGIKVHLGAQVGESGILSAAARSFAMVNKAFENYEGSMNGFLLKSDLTNENLTVAPGGYGTLAYSRGERNGFGVSIAEGSLESWSSHRQAVIAEVQASV
jgi:L-alanine-DL-glutamate epimerase-like enolase superfamily enzyme